LFFDLALNLRLLARESGRCSVVMLDSAHRGFRQAFGANMR
jgi:hypothetical protein